MTTEKDKEPRDVTAKEGPEDVESELTDRYAALCSWMAAPERGITFEALGIRLGLTESGARNCCKGATCKTGHWSTMIALGFPEDLIPKALDKRPGRKKRVPRFPGLDV